jgi:dihydrofolate reductase
MTSTTISIIVAMGRNRVIGKDGGLPWSLPDDHENFHQVTAGKPFIMGKLSYLSEDRLLSSYRNVILSTQQDFELCENCEGATSLEEALALTADEPEVFILGGETVFEAALPVANKFLLTLVETNLEGDTYFPEVDWEKWTETESTFHPKDDRNSHAFYLKVLVRH